MEKKNSLKQYENYKDLKIVNRKILMEIKEQLKDILKLIDTIEKKINEEKN